MASVMVEIINPAFANIETELELQHLAFASKAPSRPLRLALLDNQKPNSTELLSLVAAELAPHLDVQTRSYQKQSPGMAAPPEVLDSLAQWADVAIFASAD